MSFHLAVQEGWHCVVSEFLPSFIVSLYSMVNRTGTAICAKHFVTMTRQLVESN